MGKIVEERLFLIVDCMNYQIIKIEKLFSKIEGTKDIENMISEAKWLIGATAQDLTASMELTAAAG